MGDVDVNKVIEEFASLPVEDKEYVAGIIHKQLVELGRERISRRAAEAKENVEKGRVRQGTIEDLRKDLEND
jgi:hypothetical protein